MYPEFFHRLRRVFERSIDRIERNRATKSMLYASKILNAVDAQDTDTLKQLFTSSDIRAELQLSARKGKKSFADAVTVIAGLNKDADTVDYLLTAGVNLEGVDYTYFHNEEKTKLAKEFVKERQLELAKSAKDFPGPSKGGFKA